METYKKCVLAFAAKIFRSASTDLYFSRWEQDVCRVELQQLKEKTFYFEDIIENARTFARGSRLRTEWWKQIVRILKFYYHGGVTFWWL